MGGASPGAGVEAGAGVFMVGGCVALAWSAKGRVARGGLGVVGDMTRRKADTRLESS
jgi:hypothetical protein